MVDFVSLRRLLIASAAVALAAITGGREKPAGSIVSVSIPALRVAAGERVAGFEFDVAAGRIVRVPDMPIGWNISVDNDPSWNTKITGSILVAAAAVDASFFKNFLVIEKEANPQISFAIQGNIDVSEDFVRSRKIQIGISDLTLTPTERK